MIPISDYNPTRRTPYVTYIIIAANVLVFLYQLTLSQRELFMLFLDSSVVPRSVSQDPLTLEALLDTLRSMFFHGGVLHLGSNMLYLWVFGDNIEDRLGHAVYAAFYFASGLAAVFAQVIMNTQSQIPLVGASGAIAGVLGGYFLLYPTARVRNIVFLGLFFFTVDLPALLVLGFWFVMQLFNGAVSLGVETGGGGVAFFAHIGGFVAGMAMMGVNRVAFGAPPPPEYVKVRRVQPVWGGSGRYRPVIPPAPAQRTVIMPPDPAFGAAERIARQGLVYEQLEGVALGGEVWLVTEARTFYGRLVALTRQEATIRESSGVAFVIPLENILRVG